ncbi:hypothetical protein [Croceitalea rosinachiae]|uniref:Uncharacterized protein n=1 Tax=Croceitalea rosinachiae TaxID=3075596 RepID=A0ABU3ADX4_9FLAO|nr:hypothetical protein [Croceitalea sp. F388]MDT0608100.1 hypothetical protein [Croceitalea sp. F388]
MIEFLESSYFIVLYLVTLIVAIATYRNYFDTALQLFPIYIAYTFFTELLGYFITTYEEFSFFEDIAYSWHNVAIFNLYGVLVFSFFSWVYYQVLEKNSHKKIVRWGSLAILASYLISSFFQDPLHTGLFYSDALASWFLVLVVLLYFKERRIQEKVIFDQYNLMFWVSSGLFVFHIFFPFLYVTGFLKPNIWIAYHFREILKILIVISYSFFLWGLLVSKRNAFH